jgi:hypothetical protein
MYGFLFAMCPQIHEGTATQTMSAGKSNGIWSCLQTIEAKSKTTPFHQGARCAAGSHQVDWRGDEFFSFPRSDKLRGWT